MLPDSARVLLAHEHVELQHQPKSAPARSLARNLPIVIYDEWKNSLFDFQLLSN